ncbi:YggT family protein [Synechococcus sp. PCC 7336]|uniref:YggT family protein n=1 Tax=Synechococcus sp. PCC 7336 TaxID=195250 RepID=UPI00034A1D85|nr:YggT family protein [Synechococcus sp. PCC 7336]
MVLILVAVIARTLSIYSILLIIRVLLTWFPNVDWSNPIFSVLRQLTDPYLNLFRSIVPSFGGLDFSPMLAIILLQVVQGALVKAVVSF